MMTTFCDYAYKFWYKLRSRHLPAGGRVESSWLDSYEAFLLDVGGRPSPRHYLVKRTPAEGFVKGNLVWEDTSSERRGTRWVRERINNELTLNGETRSLRGWAALNGVPERTLRLRLRRGWPDEVSVTLPVHAKYKTRSDKLPEDERRRRERQRHQKWVATNREYVRTKNREGWVKNKTEKSRKFKEWRQKNPEKAKASSDNWRRRNLDRVRANKRSPRARQTARAYQNARYSQDSTYLLMRRLRAAYQRAVKRAGRGKPDTTLKMMGAGWPSIRKYLEKKAGFLPGQCDWDVFHVDHIRPLASFNLADTEQVRRAMHWSNLQLLVQAANLSKNDSWDGNDSHIRLDLTLDDDGNPVPLA
jgi:hypothetical protein